MNRLFFPVNSLLIGLFLISQSLQAQSLPTVTDVDLQPLKAQVNRLIQAKEYLGEPFAETTKLALGQALGQADETAQVLGDGPLAQAAFLDRQVRSHRDWLSADRQRGRAVMLELLRLGVFLNPMGTKLYLSLVHSENEIEELTTHFATALRATSSI